MTEGSVKDWPRGHFEMKNEWSKDHTNKYFEGSWNRVIWPAFKTLIVILINIYLYTHDCPFLTGLAINFAIMAVYQPIVAFFTCLIAMPTNDQNLFISTHKAHINCMNITTYEGVFDEKWVRQHYAKMAKYEKFRYCVEYRLGDVYYKKMPWKKALEKAIHWESDPQKTLKNQHDFDCFVRDNLNKKMPMDGPMWRVYAQKWKTEEGKDAIRCVWKAHHALMDGVSGVLVTAAGSNEYSKDYFLASKDIGIVSQIVLKMSAPLYTLSLVWDSMMANRDDNVITKKKKKMTGEINVATSPVFQLAEVKDLSKKLGVTINDVVCCALSTSLKQYFKLKGDKLGNAEVHKHIQLMMPASLRWGFDKTREKIKVENRIAAIPLKLPLMNDMAGSYAAISKLTKALKSKFPYMYASYATAFWGCLLSPRMLPRLLVHKTTMVFTCAFSNTPGPTKAFQYTDSNGNTGLGTTGVGYIIASGRVGLTICAISWAKVLQFSVVCDDGMMSESDVRTLNDLIAKNIQSEIKRMKDTPIPDKQVKADESKKDR